MRLLGSSGRPSVSIRGGVPARVPGEKTELVTSPTGGAPPLGEIGLDAVGVDVVEAKSEDKEAFDRR